MMSQITAAGAMNMAACHRTGRAAPYRRSAKRPRNHRGRRGGQRHGPRLSSRLWDAVEQVGNAPVLMRLMRHADISTTMKYYVTADAASTAGELWEKFGNGNTFGNT